MLIWICAFKWIYFRVCVWFQYRVWSRTDRIHQTNYALWAGPVIQNFYDTEFATPYPLPKLGLVCLLTYRISLIAYTLSIGTKIIEHRLWMTLNGQYALYCSKYAFLEPIAKLWMKIDPYYQRQNVGQWLVSRNIRCMRIFVGVLRGGGVKQGCGGENKLCSSFMRQYLKNDTWYDHSY